MEYEKYKLSRKEEGLCLVVAIGLSALAAWLLYRNLLGMILFFVLYPYCKNSYKKRCIEKQKKELLQQFKDMMLDISAALLSGYSVENAWKEAEKEVRKLYGENAYMAVELKEMNAALGMNQPVEQLLYAFALRSKCEDIISFAEVFRFAKRSGGHFGKIIHRAATRISEKQEIEQEIQTVIAGKRMEQNVMNIVPIGLLGYLNLTSGEFLEPLYGNVFGVLVMTGAFLAYIGALELSKRIMQFQI